MAFNEHRFESSEGTKSTPEPDQKPSYQFHGDKPPAALARLRDKRCWVAWNYRLKNGKWTKPPFNPCNGRLASVSDPETWGTFDEALGMKRCGLAGVGLVLANGSGITGIDMDDCISDAGTYSELAAEILAYGETYAEVSPSGEGIRLFALGRVDRALKEDAAGVEVYGSDRYLTVTGNKMEEAPDEIREAPRTLARLRAVVEAAREAKRQKGHAKGANGDARRAHAGDFFDNVNTAALARLDVWVPVLHPTAKKHATGAWRITSRDLGRDLDEDLAYHPTGIKDHGEGHGLTPIDAVLKYVKYGDAADAKAAAMWLCQHIGVEPAAMGWKAGSQERPGARTDDAAPDMSIVRRNRISAPAFPIDVFGQAEDWVRTIAESKSAPLDYVALGLLVVTAGMIGPKRRVSPWDGWDEPSILWGALVGEPSSHKSPPIDPMRDAVRAIETEINAEWAGRQAKYETDKQAAEARRATWEHEVKTAVKDKKTVPTMPLEANSPKAPTRHRIWIVDVTAEQVARTLGENLSGLVCFRDELAGLLGGFDKYGGSGSDRAFWIETYGGRPYRYDRVSLKGEVVDIPFCSVSLLGGLQPDRLNSMLLSGDDDGLAARPLYAWPDPVPSRRPTRVPDRHALQAALQRLRDLQFDSADDGAVRPRTILLEAEAANEFQAWWEHKQWNAKLTAGGRLAGAIGKLDGVTLRIALVLEFLSWAWRQSNTPEPEQVSLESVRNALRIIDEWVRPNLERVFAEASLSPPQRDAMTIGRWLLKNRSEKINARDLRRKAGFPGPKESKEMDAALEVLVDARWISLQRDGGELGRTRKDFIVNPAIYEVR